MGQFAIPLALTALSAGAQYVNTRNVERRQDAQQAMTIRKQGEIQRKADAKVGEEVTKLEASRSDDERAKRLEDYTKALVSTRGKRLAGLSPTIGSDAFKADSANAATQVEQYAGDNAGLMSRVDAPGMQRQGEAFGFGHLATDIGLLGRESQGEEFLNQLAMSRIRRNPWLDAFGQVAGGMAGAYGQGGVVPPGMTRAGYHAGMKTGGNWKGGG